MQTSKWSQIQTINNKSSSIKTYQHFLLKEYLPCLHVTVHLSLAESSEAS